MKKLAFGLLFVFAAQDAFAHARLLSPAPRSNNAGIKAGPCGGLARGAPTRLTPGSTITVAWEETINHPGRYILSLSPANDLGFENNVINANIPDRAPSAADPLPLRYSFQWTVPDIECETCTLQLIQSMEENPAAPSLYYSCADIRISRSATLPPPPAPIEVPSPEPGGNETAQSSTSDVKKPAMASCGLAASGGSGHGPWGGSGHGPFGPMTACMLALPLLLLARIRLRESGRRPALAKIR